MNLKTRRKYSFRTLAPAVLGVEVKNATLTMIVDYDEAIRRDTVDLRFKTIYRVLDPKPINDPRVHDYYVFKTEQGSELVLCSVWIDEASIVEVTVENFRAVFNNTDAETMTRVEAAIKSLGVKDFSIERI